MAYTKRWTFVVSKNGEIAHDVFDNEREIVWSKGVTKLLNYTLATGMARIYLLVKFAISHHIDYFIASLFWFEPWIFQRAATKLWMLIPD